MIIAATLQSGLALAEQVTDSNQRLTLIDMAQSWLELAVQAEKNGQSDLVYETGL